MRGPCPPLSPSFKPWAPWRSSRAARLCAWWGRVFGSRPGSRRACSRPSRTSMCRSFRRAPPASTSPSSSRKPGCGRRYSGCTRRCSSVRAWTWARLPRRRSWLRDRPRGAGVRPRRRPVGLGRRGSSRAVSRLLPHGPGLSRGVVRCRAGATQRAGDHGSTTAHRAVQPPRHRTAAHAGPTRGRRPVRPRGLRCEGDRGGADRRRRAAPRGRRGRDWAAVRRGRGNGKRERAVRDRARIDYLTAVPPLRLATVPGFETCVVRFTTDIPHLTNWGTPLLLGPGSILDAHSAHERISEAELAEGADAYVRLVHALAVRKAEV